ncbi:hypothetical protein MRB53_042268 [Persea americana]|nr:hypothetical protein MRB53_042268 [Persea americana]
MFSRLRTPDHDPLGHTKTTQVIRAPHHTATTVATVISPRPNDSFQRCLARNGRQRKPIARKPSEGPPRRESEKGLSRDAIDPRRCRGMLTSPRNDSTTAYEATTNADTLARCDCKGKAHRACQKARASSAEKARPASLAVIWRARKERGTLHERPVTGLAKGATGKQLPRFDPWIDLVIGRRLSQAATDGDGEARRKVFGVCLQPSSMTGSWTYTLLHARMRPTARPHPSQP